MSLSICVDETAFYRSIEFEHRQSVTWLIVAFARSDSFTMTSFSLYLGPTYLFTYSCYWSCCWHGYCMPLHCYSGEQSGRRWIIRETSSLNYPIAKSRRGWRINVARRQLGGGSMIELLVDRHLRRHGAVCPGQRAAP